MPSCAPAFDAIVREMAQGRIDRARAKRAPAQVDLRVMGQAQLVLGDPQAAADSLRRAIERGGPYTDAIVRELDALERGALPGAGRR